MIRLNQGYSYTRTRKMNNKKAKTKKVKAGLKDLLYVLLSLVVLHAIGSHIPKASIQTARAIEVPVIQKQIVQVQVPVVKADQRVAKLRAYLNSKNSPLAPYSELIVAQADKYGIDWTKIVAISCMESSCGTKLPDGSHNAWGLGGSRFMYFNTWEEGIDYVSSLLGNNYKENEYQAIKANYCPSSDNCNPQWASVVTNTSKDILAVGEVGE